MGGERGRVGEGKSYISLQFTRLNIRTSAFYRRPTQITRMLLITAATQAIKTTQTGFGNLRTAKWQTGKMRYSGANRGCERSVLFSIHSGRKLLIFAGYLPSGRTSMTFKRYFPSVVD